MASSSVFARGGPLYSLMRQTSRWEPLVYPRVRLAALLQRMGSVLQEGAAKLRRGRIVVDGLFGASRGYGLQRNFHKSGGKPDQGE